MKQVIVDKKLSTVAEKRKQAENDVAEKENEYVATLCTLDSVKTGKVYGCHVVPVKVGFKHIM